MDNRDKAIEKIKEGLKLVYPDISDYHTRFLKEMVEYFEEMSHAEKPIFWYYYNEYIGVEMLNRMAKGLEYELIEKGYRHAKITKYEPKNDFEDGVCNSIGYLYFIAHCMLP